MKLPKHYTPEQREEHKKIVEGFIRSSDGQEIVREKIKECRALLLLAGLRFKEAVAHQPDKSNLEALVKDPLFSHPLLQQFFAKEIYKRDVRKEITLTTYTQTEKQLQRDLVKWLLLLPRSEVAKKKLDLATLKRIPIESLHPFERVREEATKIKALCPFHDERTPSFFIYTDDNHFHCFGCQENGDNIKFLMLLNRCSFVDACEILRSRN